MAQQIDQVFTQVKKTTLAVQHQLELLESGKDTSLQLQGELSRSLNELGRLIQTLDGLVAMEPGQRREMWRKKSNQVADEYTALRSSMDTYMERTFRKQKEAADREALFRGRQQVQGGDSHVINMLTNERTSLNRSHAAVEGMLTQGADVLRNLVGQRERLKRVQRRMLDVMNSLGLSNTIMRMIERREYTDRWLVYSGMAFTVLFTWGLVHYTRSGPAPPAS
eukprot:tig00000076_g2329.t1